MSGLAGTHNLRIVGQPDPALPDPVKIVVDVQDDQADQPDIADNGDILRITHADGAITVSLDGKELTKVIAPPEAK